jgi:hypothetical protein
MYASVRRAYVRASVGFFRIPGVVHVSSTETGLARPDLHMRFFFERGHMR